jgi:phospholipase D1/2
VSRIIVPGKNASLVARSELAGVMIDGEDYYRAFVEVARTAQRYLLISGWQFDSEVDLLRGEEAIAAKAEPKTLLRFLDHLCRTRPELRVYILAWDFNLLFALEREWMQRWIFDLTTHERLRFELDGKVAVGASQHQKLVVADGRYAFLGGMDICEHRWDTRRHLPDDPQRVTHLEEPYDPYHDLQCWLAGPVAHELAKMFQERWREVVGERIALPEPLPLADHAPIEPTVRLPAGEVALSRTQQERGTFEVRALFVDAISSAERLIYIENQYLTSRVVYGALVARMRAAKEPLEIVIVLPKALHAPKERLALGGIQAQILHALVREAKATGHHLGIYFPATRTSGGEIVPTYVHSKVIIVDDRFCTIGSANTTNRSLALDAELNVSWEAGPHDRLLIEAIRRLRADLLGEHCGCPSLDFERISSLVSRIDRLASLETTRIHKHPLDKVLEPSPAIDGLLPDDLGFDPELPLDEEEITTDTIRHRV